jgi:hypothetical protein
MFQSCPAGAFGELEAVQQLVPRLRRAPADEVTDVQLGHLVVRQVQGCDAMALQDRE